MHPQLLTIDINNLLTSSRYQYLVLGTKILRWDQIPSWTAWQAMLTLHWSFSISCRSGKSHVQQRCLYMRLWYRSIWDQWNV